MSAERPVSIGAIFRQKAEDAFEFVAPPLKEYRVRVEQAKRNLDIAYSQLGGETGKDVNEEQIRAVLNAELGILRTSFLPTFAFQFGFVDKRFLEAALSFNTLHGLDNASLFMSTKYDYWKNIAHKLKVAESDPGIVNEAERRTIACDNAQHLLDEMSQRLLNNPT